MASKPLKPPIILIGNVRSGTTMVQSYLSRHPDLTMWFEPRTVWAFADPGRKHDRFTEKDASDRVARSIHKRFLKFQEHHDDKQIVEKTPSNTLRIPYVHRIFPDSKIVYIVRNPLDQLSSSELKWQKPARFRRVWVRMKQTPKSQWIYYLPRFVNDQVRKRILRRKHISVWGVRYPGIYDDLRKRSVEEILALQWLNCVEHAARDLAKLPSQSWMMVRYEDIIDDPVGQFRRIFEHIGIEPTSALEDEIAAGIRPNLNAKWKRMDPDVVARCLAIVSETMTDLGYAPPTEADLRCIDEAVRRQAEQAAHDTTHGVRGV